MHVREDVRLNPTREGERAACRNYSNWGDLQEFQVHNEFNGRVSYLEIFLFCA